MIPNKFILHLMHHFIVTAVSVFEATKVRPEDKRKRQRNYDSSDIDGYLGPWGKFVDEKTIMKPDEVFIYVQNNKVITCNMIS